eukprot:PITA_01764
MKDLGVANYILGMKIKRDWEKRKLWLNQRKYVETILQRFNMQDSKPVKVLVPVGVRLSTEQCPKTQEEEEDMSCVPYASAVGSFMYVMVCTRPDIAHAVGVLSRFMSKLGKEHWTTVKRVFRWTWQVATNIHLDQSMGLVQGAIRIDGDSQSAIFLANNPAYHSNTKHINVQYHFVRDMIEDKKVLLVKVDTLKNTADALTKSVKSEKFS